MQCCEVAWWVGAPSADCLLPVKDYGSVPCLDLYPGPLLKTHPSSKVTRKQAYSLFSNIMRGMKLCTVTGRAAFLSVGGLYKEEGWESLEVDAGPGGSLREMARAAGKCRTIRSSVSSQTCYQSITFLLIPSKL